MKLVNLNAWHGGRNLWQNLVDYLVAEQPDILTLQEAYASDAHKTEPYFKTAESLQAILGMPYAEHSIEFILEKEYGTAPIGNAILSKFPLFDPKIVWLEGTSVTHFKEIGQTDFSDAPRNLLHAKTEINGNPYNLMTTHGVWAKDSNETELQKAMGKTISDYIYGKKDIILTGDFNVNENSETINGIEKYLVNIFKGERKSSFNMAHKTDPGYATAVVDFIFASKNIKVARHYTSDHNVSDHQSQVIIFDL